jgi:hypothetical protein
MMAMGVRPTGNAAMDSRSLLKAIGQRFSRLPPGLIGPILRGLGAESVISPKDVRAYLGASEEERAELLEKVGKETREGKFELPPKMEREWSDFEEAVTSATLTIRNELIKGMTGLTGPGSELSGAVGELSAKIRELIERIGRLFGFTGGGHGAGPVSGGLPIGVPDLPSPATVVASGQLPRFMRPDTMVGSALASRSNTSPLAGYGAIDFSSPSMRVPAAAEAHLFMQQPTVNVRVNNRSAQNIWINIDAQPGNVIPNIAGAAVWGG